MLFILRTKGSDIMNARQRKFADEYLIDCNATQAAKRAGYSERYANTNAAKLLQNTTVKTYIEEQLEKMHSDKIADAEEVMVYLTSVLRGDAISEIVVVEGIGEGCSSARTLEKSPDERERLKAAELLGKRFGMFKDTVNLTGRVPVVIHDDMDEEDDG